MNRWRIYEMLRGNCKFNNNIIKDIKATSIEELQEGVIEYLLFIKANHYKKEG